MTEASLLPILFVPDPKPMYKAPGIGLAAIQVAVAKRIVVIDLGKTEEDRAPLYLINPEIIWASEELSVYEEGCLSVPDYFEEVKRPAKVRVRHMDRDGAVKEFDAEGLLATVVQHEMDHLEGGLFIDHLSRLKRERVVKKFNKAARFDDIVAQRRAEAEAQSEEAGA